MTARQPRSPHTAFGAGRTIGWLLQVQAKARPSKPFFTWEPFTGESQVWTYADFSAATLRVAAGLHRSGVGENTFVLIHLDNRPEYLLAWFACAHLGAIAVCTNTRSTLDELSYTANHSGAQFAITQPNLEGLVSAALPTAKEIWVVSDDHFSPQSEKNRRFDTLLQASSSASPTCSARSVAFVQYTSGATGRPKGVVFNHSNALWAAKVNATHEGLRESDVHLVYLPLFHINAMGYSVLASLWVGASLVLLPRFTASRFWEVAVRHKCTWASQITFALNVLSAAEVPAHHFRLWGTGICGHALEAHFRVPMIGWWGMTETVSHPIVGDLHVDNRPGAIGRPAPEYEVAVVREDGSAVEADETGGLLVRGIPGTSLFCSYLHDEIATANAFDSSGWFKTGDLVKVHSDGAISFVDRAKDMLKVGGENVAASEIERVILAVPGIAEVAVVAGPHPLMVEVPVAFVVVKNGPVEIEARILDACRRQLAEFKVPRLVRVVHELPRAGLGKIAKHELRAQLRAEAAAGAMAWSV
jgi:crotonobetaine/carnitine-CoA ligase